MCEFYLVKHPWMGKRERIRRKQGESSDSDAGLTFVKGVEVNKIGQEKLQTTVEFWDSLGQCDEESLGKCSPLKKFVLERWPSFTAPPVLSHCLGVIAWRSKGRGWGGECGLSEHSSGSKGTAAGCCRTAMLLAAGFPEGWAKWAISVSVTVTYCIAKLGYFSKIYC